MFKGPGGTFEPIPSRTAQMVQQLSMQHPTAFAVLSIAHVQDSKVCLYNSVNRLMEEADSTGSDKSSERRKRRVGRGQQDAEWSGFF